MQRKFFLEKTKQRLAASILVGMLAAVLTVPHGARPGVTGAWWGVLYPQYCCTAGEQGADDGKTVSVGSGAPRVKIRFRWLHGF